MGAGAGVSVWVEKLGEGAALGGWVVVRGGVWAWIFVFVGWPWEVLSLELPLSERGEVVDVRVEIGCLERGVEAKLGDCHSGRRLILSSGWDEAAGNGNHVFTF